MLVSHGLSQLYASTDILPPTQAKGHLVRLIITLSAARTRYGQWKGNQHVPGPCFC
jgi:hypothetical protein